MTIPTRYATTLTNNPFCMLSMQLYLPSQLAVHLVETLGRSGYLPEHFKMIAECPINHESRGRKLERNGVSSQGGVPEQQEILTLRATAKASFQELSLNCIFAHTLNGGVKRVVSSPFSVERHHCRKSVARHRVNGGETRIITHQRARQRRGRPYRRLHRRSLLCLVKPRLPP